MLCDRGTKTDCDYRAADLGCERITSGKQFEATESDRTGEVGFYNYPNVLAANRFADGVTNFSQLTDALSESTSLIEFGDNGFGSPIGIGHIEDFAFDFR